MGTVVMGSWTVRGGCVGVSNVLHQDGSGGDPLQFGVMGYVPMDWEDTGSISPSGDTEADGVDDTVEQVWETDISYPRGGDGRGGNS